MNPLLREIHASSSHAALQAPESGDATTGPSFVNASTGVGTQTPGSTITVTLPVSLVTGNLLICQIRILGPAAIAWPSDWTTIEQGGGYSFAYRYVDGTETNPVVTIMGATRVSALITQWSSVRSVRPIGGHAIKTNSASPASHSGLTSLFNNCRILMCYGQSGSSAPGTASGWTRHADQSPGTSSDHHVVDSKAVAAAGTASGAWSVTNPGFSSGVLGLELRGT